MSKRYIAEKARANTNGVELDSFAQRQTSFSANLTETPQSQDQVKIPVSMSHSRVKLGLSQNMQNPSLAPSSRLFFTHLNPSK